MMVGRRPFSFCGLVFLCMGTCSFFFGGVSDLSMIIVESFVWCFPFYLIGLFGGFDVWSFLKNLWRFDTLIPDLT